MNSLTASEMEEALKEILKDIKIAGSTCEFYGEEHEDEDCDEHGCGLWMSGEEGNIMKEDDMPAFAYWNEGEKIHPSFDNWAEERGWHVEWNDPGTIMFYRDD